MGRAVTPQDPAGFACRCPSRLPYSSRRSPTSEIIQIELRPVLFEGSFLFRTGGATDSESAPRTSTAPPRCESASLQHAEHGNAIWGLSRRVLHEYVRLFFLSDAAVGGKDEFIFGNEHIGTFYFSCKWVLDIYKEMVVSRFRIVNRVG